MKKKRVKAFGIEISLVTKDQSMAQILNWVNDSNRLCRYVVTPNVDHVVRLQGDRGFRKAYADASLVLTDGKPVYLALKMLGIGIPEVIPGSDLVPEILQAGNRRGKLRVFWLGAAPGVAKKAAQIVSSKWPNVETVGYYSPPFGFETNDLENTKIIKMITDCGPDLLILGLGAPKQELWVYAHLNI